MVTVANTIIWYYYYNSMQDLIGRLTLEEMIASSNVSWRNACEWYPGPGLCQGSYGGDLTILVVVFPAPQAEPRVKCWLNSVQYSPLESHIEGHASVP